MKIGLVGYQGSGKTTLFEWLTGQAPDLALGHIGQSAMAPIPDPRIAQLCEVYQPKKVTQASLEIFDTPGLSRSQEGNAARLATIREAGCLVLVVAAFSGAKAEEDLKAFEEDLLLTDLDMISGRIGRLQESVKKPRPNRDQELAELALLEPLKTHLESEKPLRDFPMTPDQQKGIRSFRFLTEKPKLIIVNTADDVAPSESVVTRPDGSYMISSPVGLELELTRMSEDERVAFENELGLKPGRRDLLIRTMLEASGQITFFTAGEKEVRTWMLRKGGTALEAADGIHSDLARGFIRAETMSCADLVRLGSEREMKAKNLVRQEPKDYVVKDDDILNIKFSV